MIPRINVGKGVTGAVRYTLGEGRDPKTGELKELAPGAERRVDWIGGTGFAFEVQTESQVDLARREMEFDALNQTSRTRICEQDCVHISLGWRPGEKPTREQMEAAAMSALNALGMGNAKALFVAHNDEDYSHVHIVASKINPETGRAYDLAASWRTLSTWAERYERENGGIVCARRETANELRDAIARRDAGDVLDALTEQRATFTPAQLENALGKEIKDERERGRFSDAILDHAEAVHLAERPGGPTTRYTTRSVIEAELYVLRAAEGLAGRTGFQIDDRQSAAVLHSERFDGITREQARAFRHATGAEGLAIIDGQAGTGKSFTIAAIREAYEAAGCNVIGLAPTNAVAQDMKADGFGRAATIHSELFALNNGRTTWNGKTVVIVDEAAMLDTKLMAMVTAHAHDAGAKLILVGDDRQLSSIDRGGMFGALKDRHGAAELSEVKRQHKVDERRAAEMMAEGNFHDALGIYEQKGAIHWTRTQGEARAELVDQWAKDSAGSSTDKTRFVFAYTNDDVNHLNAALRDVRKERGELGEDHAIDTGHGRRNFAAGDRIQFTATDKKQGINNGAAGTIEAIDGTHIAVKLDGRQPKTINFDAAAFDQFRHGYAGTIYRGQGRTLDQTYLYHSEHWRSAASYVGLTRHRDKAELFVARNTAKDVNQLARQMGRTDDRRAASMFHHRQEIGPVRPLTAEQILARFGDPKFTRAAGHGGGRTDAQRDQGDPQSRPEQTAAAEPQRGRQEQPAPPANENAPSAELSRDDVAAPTEGPQSDNEPTSSREPADRPAETGGADFNPQIREPETGAASLAADALASVAGKVADIISDLISPTKPPTRQQQELNARAAEEKAEERGEQQQRTDAKDWELSEKERQQQQERTEEPTIYDRFAGLTRDEDEEGREDERQRDAGRERTR